MNNWTKEKAEQWYKRLPWLVGCNSLPSNAINQLEMWQAGTFDIATIKRELAWAAGLGMNTARVYLHDLAWKVDAEGFKARVDGFLDCAAACGIRPILVFFDDCWNACPRAGKQPDPIPGVHNSGWMQSPGVASVNNPATWGPLEDYVHDIVSRFRADERVLMWDVYNEPGNSLQKGHSLPLLCKAFQWAREADPLQPLTAGIWHDNVVFNTFQAAESDIITFHNYNDAANLAAQIAELRKHGRPLICTEWLRRGVSDVATCLPVFARQRVGCCNWGLVCGKSQTNYPWGSASGAAEPALWQHDLLRQDGSAYKADEVRIFRELTQSIRRA